MSAVPALLRVLEGCLRALAAPFTLLGLTCAWIAAPILWAAGRLQERACAWDRRLGSRERRTDLHPPPGA